MCNKFITQFGRSHECDSWLQLLKIEIIIICANFQRLPVNRESTWLQLIIQFINDNFMLKNQSLALSWRVCRLASEFFSRLLTIFLMHQQEISNVIHCSSRVDRRKTQWTFFLLFSLMLIQSISIGFFTRALERERSLLFNWIIETFIQLKLLFFAPNRSGQPVN